MSESKIDEKKICDNILSITNFFNNFQIHNVPNSLRASQLRGHKELANSLIENARLLQNLYAKWYKQCSTESAPKTLIDSTVSDFASVNSQDVVPAEKNSGPTSVNPQVSAPANKSPTPTPDLNPKTDSPSFKKETQVLLSTNPINDFFGVLGQNLDSNVIEELNKIFENNSDKFKDIIINSNLKIANDKFSRINDKLKILNNIPGFPSGDALVFKMDEKERSTNSSIFYLLFMYFYKTQSPEIKLNQSSYLAFITKFTNFSICLIKTNIQFYCQLMNPTMDLNIRDMFNNSIYPFKFIKKIQKFVVEEYVKNYKDYSIFLLDEFPQNIRSFTNLLTSPEIQKDLKLDGNDYFASCLDYKGFDIISNNDAYIPLVSLNCGIKMSDDVKFKLKLYLLGKKN